MSFRSAAAGCHSFSRQGRWNRLVGIAGLALLAACSGDDKSSKPSSALLITFDTTRSDAFGCYGGMPGLTPAIDRLAQEGVAFDQAYAVTPMTQPSHASMMTGLYPPRHGIRINGNGVLPSSAVTLAEMAVAADLQTAAFVSSVVLDEAFGLNQGFETYDTPKRDLAGNDGGYASRGSKAVMTAAMDWFAKRDRSRPFFVWIHVWDPHHPWSPESKYIGLTGGNLYLAAISNADAELGELLKALREDGTLDETVVLLVADHGEAFGEHGEASHSSHIYQSTMSVPMIIRYPDQFQAGTRIATVTSVADVQPTLAAAMGLTPKENLDGRSLFRQTQLEERGAYIESYFGYMCFAWSPLSGWVGKEGKYLHSSNPVFFDLNADAEENNNILEQRQEVVARYKRSIEAMVARPALVPDLDATVDAQLQGDLEAIGYASSGMGDKALPHPLAASDLPSPLDRMDERNMTLEILDLLKDDDHAGAEKVCRIILETNPDNSWVLDRFAFCLIRQRRLPEAVKPLLKIVESGHATSLTYSNLGGCMRSMGEEEKALAYFELSIALDPNKLLPLRQAAELLERAGRKDEAAAYRARFEEVSGTKF